MNVELLADVSADGALAHVLVRLHADIAGGGDRNPVNLALVLDRSSSMRGPRFTQALRAATQLVDQLGPRDRVSVISFDAAAHVVFGPAPLSGEDKHKLQAILSNLDTGVGTNLAAGIKCGADALRSGFVRNAVTRLILLTDGQPSIGITNPDRLTHLVQREHERGVTLTAMGVGQVFDDELLSELARQGAGGFYYLASAADIPAAFGHELAGVFSIAASSTELRFIPSDSVLSVELLHRLPSRPMDDGLLVQLGDIAANAPRQVLFKLHCDPGVSSRCGTLAVSYKLPDGRAGDGHVVGVDLADCAGDAAARQVTLERLRIAVATAVDVAWARRASGDKTHALAAVDEMKKQVIEARDHDRADAAGLAELLDNIADAETAVAKSDVERRDARRSMRQRSHSTLMGQSIIQMLPREDD